MTRPPFPTVLDSTIIAAARSCGQKVKLEFFEHWKARDPSVHLHAGAAYAHGLERARRSFYEAGNPADIAIAHGLRSCMEAYGDFECPPDSAKSLERTVGALEYYFTRYPLDTDAAKPIELPGGKRGIEFGFVEPLDESHPETGDPLLYSGRMDMVVSFEGMTLGLDDKTTSQLGASWPRQWDLRSQFTGYCLLPDTEVLTRDGWLRIDQLKQGQAIVQWDKTGAMAWVIPSELHSPDFEGSLITCDGKVSFGATPNHRQIVWDTWTKSYKSFTTDRLPRRSGALRFISAGRLIGGMEYPEPFVKMLVAIQADGSWRDGGVRFHFSKERKAKRLTEILVALEIKHSWHNTKDYSIHLSQDLEWIKLAKEVLGEKKLFGDWLLSFSQSSLTTFIEEVAFWDGTARNSRGWMYFSTNEKNAEWVRTVASITGHYSSIHIQNSMYRVNITEGCWHSPHLHTWGELAYSGKVYCVTVPSSYFLIRYQGRTMITGNSWGAGRQGIKLDGWLVRGVSILKSKYDTLQAITYRPQWQIDRWYDQLMKDVRHLKQQWESGEWNFNLDHACTEYGGCPFRDACLMPDPQPLLDMRFQRRKWDPVSREETVL